MSNLGWICATVMLLAVASCSGAAIVNRQNIDAARVERCESGGGTWNSWWGGQCDHPTTN